MNPSITIKQCLQQVDIFYQVFTEKDEENLIHLYQKVIARADKETKAKSVITFLKAALNNKKLIKLRTLVTSVLPQQFNEPNLLSYRDQSAIIRQLSTLPSVALLNKKNENLLLKILERNEALDLSDHETLVEVCLAKHWEILQFASLQEGDRIAIAKLCAAKNGPLTQENLSFFQITDPLILTEINRRCSKANTAPQSVVEKEIFPALFYTNFEDTFAGEHDLRWFLNNLDFCADHPHLIPRDIEKAPFQQFINLLKELNTLPVGKQIITHLKQSRYPIKFDLHAQEWALNTTTQLVSGALSSFKLNVDFINSKDDFVLVKNGQGIQWELSCPLIQLAHELIHIVQYIAIDKTRGDQTSSFREKERLLLVENDRDPFTNDSERLAIIGHSSTFDYDICENSVRTDYNQKHPNHPLGMRISHLACKKDQALPTIEQVKERVDLI